MKEWVKSSFIAGIIRWIIRFYNDTFSVWMEESLFAKAERAMGNAYSFSHARPVIDQYMMREPAVKTSLAGRITAKIAGGISALGSLLRQRLLPLWQASGIYSLWTKLYGGIERGAANGSILCRGLLYFNIRRICLYTAVLYLPIDYVLRNVIGISALASVWDELLLIVSFGTALFLQLSGRKSGIRRTPLGVPILLFMSISIFLMCINGAYPKIAFEGLRAVIEYMLFFFTTIMLLNDKKEAKSLLAVMCSMIGILSLHGIYQYIIGVEIPASWVTQTEEGVRTRVFSIVGSPNVFGSLLIIGVLLSAGFFYSSKKPIVKLLAAASVLTCGISSIFTFSKGAWGGLAVALLIFALICDRRLIVLMVVALAGAVLFVPSIISRITYLFTSDYVEASLKGGRMMRWDLGLQLLNRNPLFGFGLGMFGGAVAVNNPIFDDLEYFYMDNYYLKTLVEMGYVGLISFIGLLYSTVVWGARSLYRMRSDSFAPVYVGAFAGMVGVLIHCYFENIFEVPFMSAYFWILAAILVVSAFVCKDEQVNENPAAAPEKV